MQDDPKALVSIPYVSVAFFPSLKLNFIAYRSSKVSSRSDFIFEIHQLWQSGFSRVDSSCCCSCSYEPEIIRIGQSSHKIYSNNVVNFQESTTTLNAHTKKVWKLMHLVRGIESKATKRGGWKADIHIIFKPIFASFTFFSTPPYHLYNMICFNGMSTRLEQFYVNRLGNRVHWTFTFFA